MPLERSSEDSPARPASGAALVEEERRYARPTTVASGSLACPRCDAPVVPARPLAPSDSIGCPFCSHTGRVRDFLSLGAPARPARVVVRVAAG